MTILPSFLMTGILAVVLSLAILIWSFGFLRSRLGGQVLMVLSSVLLLFGGGLFPPLIGLVAGAAATQICKSIPGEPGSIIRWAAKLWPWPLVLLMIWLFGQFPVGYLFNDQLKSSMGFGLLLILTMLPLSIFVGYACDSVNSKYEGDRC